MLSPSDLETYALAKKGVTKSYPFYPYIPVFKVLDKMFLLYNEEKDEPLQINVKCDPLYALELRTIYDSVVPGYHMNKKHWNTVYIDGDIDNETLLSFIDDSYDLVVAGFSKKKQKELLGDSFS